MGLSLAEIQRHRGKLIERARAQRETVRSLLDNQRDTFWMVDRGIALGKLIAARKGPILAVALGFAIVQPRRALRLTLRAWSLFRLVRKVRRAFG